MKKEKKKGKGKEKKAGWKREQKGRKEDLALLSLYSLRMGFKSSSQRDWVIPRVTDL